MRRRLFGFDEVWRDDSTGTRRFYILWMCVWETHFTHSTWMWQ
jgi:hypothetical protein